MKERKSVTKAEIIAAFALLAGGGLTALYS